MANLLAEAGVNLPNISGGSLANFGLYVLGFFFAVIILGILTWVFIRYKKYNQKILIFRKINGVVMPFGKDQGWFQRIGKAGDYWCRTLKTKKILPKPTIAMGRNTFWYYIREDGEWINFGVENIDDKMKSAGVYYVDEDMRLQRLGIEKNIRDRFEKKEGFFAKYGGLIVNIFFILIVMVALILLFKEMGGLADKLGNVAGSINKLAEATTNMVAQARSGVVPA